MKNIFRILVTETSLVVQWLRLHTLSVGGLALIPSLGRFHMPQVNKVMPHSCCAQYTRVCRLQLLSLCVPVPTLHTEGATAVRAPGISLRAQTPSTAARDPVPPKVG